MCNYISNKKPTHAFAGDHKIFVKFVSKYPCLGDEKVLKSFSNTRWEAYSVAIEAILKFYHLIIEGLEYL